MRCDDVRIAISAALDGEPADDIGDTAPHLAACADCRRWQEQATAVTRTVRLQPADVPDLTERVLAAVHADPVGRQRQAAARGRRQVLRVAVAAASVVQLVSAVPALLAAALPDAGLHTGREMASFDIALAFGFLLAAARPEHARTVAPVAAVLAACLAVSSGIDVAANATGLAHELGHLVAVVLAGLLWALGRSTRTAPTVKLAA